MADLEHFTPRHRPFRFGVLSFGSPSGEAWRELARRAEGLGYATLSVDEHMDRPLAPIAALACAAEATERLRIGSCVFANDFRHPALLAKEVATLDVLSGGRVEFGLGTGYAPVDYEQAGVRLNPPGVRVERLTEAVRLIKAAFSGDPVSMSGKHYTLRDLELVPPPVQQPHPPLLIGGGSRRILGLAGRGADIVGINLRTSATGGVDFGSLAPEATAQKVAWAREAAGQRFEQLELQLLVSRTAVTGVPQRIAEEMIHELGISGNVTIEQVLDSPHTLIGSEDEIVEKLWETRDRYHISYFTVCASAIDELAPIVARLAGK